MNELNIILLAIGIIVLGVGLFSNLIKSKLYISIPLISTVFGILIGPAGLNLLNPFHWHEYHKIVEETARITLAIALMSVALRIPPEFVKKYFLSIVLVLLLGMIFMFVTSGLLTYWIAGVPFLVAFIIGGAITPTDPVVSSAIVTGELAKKKIPSRLRRFISSEAGANDGLAYPFVLLPVLLYLYATDFALQHWVLEIILWRVGVAALIGALIGYISAKLFIFAEKHKTIEEVYFLGYTIAISLLTLSLAKLIGSDGIFSVFVAGLVFDNFVETSKRSEQENVQEAINHFFTLPVFVLFGMVLPWNQWHEAGWAGILLCAAILLFRRLPYIIVFRKMFKPLKSVKDAAFDGWFGPLGVAALYYIAFSLGEIGDEAIWNYGTLIIFSSVIIHGITATPFTQKFPGKGNS
ncbi:MAG: cation:proton antiporter [Calditrichia bacterium]